MSCSSEKTRMNFALTALISLVKMLTTIDSADYVEATADQKTLKFKDEKQQAKFELGVCMAVYKWDELNTAVENSWGGSKSADKRDWISGIVIDLFQEKMVDIELVEETLLYAMVDEFDTEIQNDSALEIAALIIKLYRQVAAKNYDEIFHLYEKWQQKQHAKTESQSIEFSPDPNNPDMESSSEEEVEELLEPDSSAMEVDKPTGPVIEDDGFQMVQPKCKRGKRR